jgi:hypothetical protein
VTAASIVLAGIAVGGLQATLLARAARRRAGGLGVLLRLGLVAAVLLVAARSGHLVAAAAGWALGFGVASLVWVRRLG